MLRNPGKYGSKGWQEPIIYCEGINLDSLLFSCNLGMFYFPFPSCSSCKTSCHFINPVLHKWVFDLVFFCLLDREGISWEAIDWMDNAECLDLIEKVGIHGWSDSQKSVIKLFSETWSHQGLLLCLTVLLILCLTPLLEKKISSYS